MDSDCLQPELAALLEHWINKLLVVHAEGVHFTFDQADRIEADSFYAPLGDLGETFLIVVGKRSGSSRLHRGRHEFVEQGFNAVFTVEPPLPVG